MVFRSVLAVCGLAATLCVQSTAQSSTAGAPPSPNQGLPAPVASQPAAPSLQLQDLPPDPHTPTPAEQQQQRQQAAINAALRLASLEAHWGPEMDTPGLSLALTEIRRMKTPEGTTQITYQISGSGFSPDEKLTLVRWPLNSEAEAVMSGVSFDTRGIAICGAQPQTAPGAVSGNSPAETPAPAGAAGAGSGSPAPVTAASCASTMQPQQPVEIQATVAQGEAVRVAVMGRDRKHGAAASVVPFPIADTDKGCRLQVILGMRDAALVLIEGTGFPANSAMQIDLVTGDNTRRLNSKTNKDGRLVIPLLPGTSGQSSGETTVRFGGVSHPPSLKGSDAPPPPDPACAPSVSFRWGKGTYKAE